MYSIKELYISGALIALMGQFGCDQATTTSPPAGEPSIEIAPAAIDTLFSVGDTVRLNAVAKDASGRVIANATITFESSETEVATVSSEGIVVSVGNGATMITASSGGGSATVPVRVRQKLARVLIVPPVFRLSVGGTTTFSASPADARGTAMDGLPTPTYSSSDSSVARVNEAGLVTGVSSGTALVTASVRSTADGTSTATAEIAVITIQSSDTVALGSNRFLPESVDIHRGGTVTFVNDSGTAHDVDFGIPDLNVAVHDSGRNTRTFGNPGTFPYHCNLHSGMMGTVFVH